MDDALLALVSDGFREVRSKAVCHVKVRDAVASLESLWNSESAAFGSYLQEAYSEDALRVAASKELFAKRPPPWYVGMTSGFRKAMPKIDRKLRERIIEALNDIAESPAKLRGNKVQPLTGTLQGCWCCRVGPAQLIYFPDQSTGDITLLALSLDPPATASQKVLLLEDRDDFREILRQHLVSHSYQLTSVSSGVDGVREIMKRPFDLIISDMMMPRMGGEMFYQAVTRVRPAASQRFIFFSGHKNNPVLEHFFQRVNAPVLYKPFNLKELDSAIADVFRRLG